MNLRIINQPGLQEIDVTCPYCNESISILLGPLSEDQQYIEDCEVCYRPITVDIRCIDGDNFELKLLQENEIS